MSTQASQLLQQAGQTIHSSLEPINAIAAFYSAAAQAAMAEAPFAVQTDQLLAAWKETSQLVQDVTALDQKLRSLFEQSRTSANSRQAPGLPRLSLADRTKAVDVRVKKVTAVPDAKLSKAPVSKLKKSAAKKKAVASVKVKASVKASVEAASKAMSVPPNAVRVYKALKGILNLDTLVPVKQLEVARSAGIPNGSITASLNVLKERGYLVEGDKHSYRLTSMDLTAATV